jgi:hypothetical protein
MRSHPAARRAASLLRAAVLAALFTFAFVAHAVELRMSRAALQRTLERQLFAGPQGRYYLKGNPRSVCSVYAEKPELLFTGDRVAVKVKIHAALGTAVAGKCLGFALAPSAEVSFVPDAEGETIGFRDARIEHVSESRELNFMLMPFLSRKVPSSMKVNAADMLRKALAGSPFTTGYEVSLDRLKIHSMTLEGDWIAVDFDGDMSVR